MNWRDEQVCSFTAAKKLFHRHVTLLNLPDCEARFWEETRGISCFASYADEQGNRETGRAIVFDVTANGEIRCWDRLRIDKPFRGKETALVSIKCDLGLAFEAGVSAIDIFMVRQEGLALWPSLGARPHHAPTPLFYAAEQVLSQYGASMRREEVADIEQRLDRANGNLERGWEEVAAIEARLPGKDKTYFRAAVMERFCENDTMYLPLTEAWTQERLAQKLGRIPPFDTLPPRKPFVRRAAPA